MFNEGFEVYVWVLAFLSPIFAVISWRDTIWLAASFGLLKNYQTKSNHQSIRWLKIKFDLRVSFVPLILRAQLKSSRQIISLAIPFLISNFSESLFRLRGSSPLNLTLDLLLVKIILIGYQIFVKAKFLLMPHNRNRKKNGFIIARELHIISITSSYIFICIYSF